MHQGRVLLVRRQKPPYRGEYSLPGGKIESGETAFDALCREMREETGLIVQAAHHYTDTIISNRFLLSCYRIDRFAGALQAGDDATHLFWMPEVALARHLRRTTLETVQKGFHARIRHCKARPRR